MGWQRTRYFLIKWAGLFAFVAHGWRADPRRGSSPVEPLGWRSLYERERARADGAEARARAAEAEAQRWRLAEIEARSKAGSYKFQFEAAREKLAEARAQAGSIRDTAKRALSLQAEVARLSKLVDAAGRLSPNEALPPTHRPESSLRISLHSY